MTEKLQLDLEPGSGTGEGNFVTYSAGYAIAMLLTLLSFGCVMLNFVPVRWTFSAIVVAALAQVYVHLAFFLHMGRRSTPRWNVIVFGFAMIVIAILVGGSIWIMATANQQMMPASDPAQLP